MDKPNLIQQCTDPSEDKHNNDSQQSSEVSQYFKNADLDAVGDENYNFNKLDEMKPGQIEIYGKEQSIMKGSQII